jgi:LysM repeat protein
MKYLIYICALCFALGAVLPAEGQVPSGNDGMSAAEMRRRARLFDEHIVRMGETTYSIARGYAVSPAMIAEDNPGIDPGRIRVGQVILIRKSERGKARHEEVTRQWQQMVDEAAGKNADKNELPVAAVQTPFIVDTPGGQPGQGGQPSRPEPGTGRQGGGQGDLPWDDPVLWGKPSRGVGSRNFSLGGVPRVAIVLPLSGTTYNPAGNAFTDFYKGALLGFEALKEQGHATRVTVYDSGRSADKVRELVASGEFVTTDLVIGPVYDDELQPMLEFGEQNGVAVVSPLETTRALDSEALWQMAPDPATKYDKLRPLLESDANIIVVSSGGADDKEFEAEISGQLTGRNVGRFTVGGGGSVASLIDWERPNLLVVLAGNEQTVNMALSTISSSYSNVAARRGRRADISVIGTSKWAGYGSFINKNLFFTLGVKFVTSYYIDRSVRATRLFEARYLEAYGQFPERAAFRGYDAVALFVGAMFEGGQMESTLLGSAAPGVTPLGTRYRFLWAPGGAKRLNDQWALVSFSNDYTISTQ